MPTHSSIFQEILRQIIPSSGTIHIEQIYKEISSLIKLVPSDKLYTTVRKIKTRELVWKRNLRNVLQQMKGNGELVNSPQSHWRWPTPNSATFLNENDAWGIVLNKAKNVLKRSIGWASPKINQRYRIIGIEEDRIIIKREDATQNDFISKNEVRRSIRILNAAGGIVSRRTLNYTVAKEATLVFLHGSLNWDSSNDNILVCGTIAQAKPSKASIIEALNDDIKEYQQAARRVRKGQPKLRKNLLELYEKECCISRTGPINVLQAAHIDPHSKSGDNSSKNALLLRSDLHDLYDDNLIAIHPTTLKIFIHPSLKYTSYQQFNKTVLKKRTDSEKPSHDRLNFRWKKANWVNSKERNF